MEQTKIEELVEKSEIFRYQLLSRLKTDCDYYLGYGNRQPNCLWAKSETGQIEMMKILYDSFPEDKRPEWLSEADIRGYAAKMFQEEAREWSKQMVKDFPEQPKAQGEIRKHKGR